jgi:hypothetical protein
MLDSGRVESTGLVGFAQTPIVLNDSLRLRVPTDRLRRTFLALTSWGGEGLPRAGPPNTPNVRRQDLGSSKPQWAAGAAAWYALGPSGWETREA